ncbi:hypothetical protein E0485_20240 [Paenibacillus albiflavus]|uniref:Uncharacterized protein n=1 Tax=Paenibacillus albiflavus TaxID=2545760 RepID=A0A4R4E3L4_9BACL|nr:hypothetical protein E0485_20240 [Paenibacillus albiflavus]
MLAIIGILAVVIVIIAVEVPRLLRGQLIKELWAFSVLLLFGTALSIAEALHIWIPTPMDWMIVVYKPVYDFFETWIM